LATFSFEIICDLKDAFEFVEFKMYFFANDSDRKLTKIKVVELQKLFNFVVDKFEFV
jgi:hypothetical protein